MPFDARDMLEVTFSAPSTTLEPSRDELTGAITGFHEVPIEDADSTAQNSFSLLRQPANPSDFVRGRTTFRPFQPGTRPFCCCTLANMGCALQEGLLTFPTAGWTLLMGKKRR